MRKGRSQRKTRGSLPSSRRAPSRLDAAASGGGATGPQVVVGLTEPLADDGALESRADAREPEHLELVREKSLEIVRESLELVRESLELQEHDAEEAASADEPAPAVPAEPVVAGEIIEHRVATLTFDASDPFRDERDEETAAATPTPAPTPVRQMSLPTPDEMSIPPMGDLSVEPIADRFFSEGELAAAGAADHDLHHEEWDQRAHKSVRKSLPEVVQRRARFAKYVRWAVGGAAVVCLAALARSVVPAAPASGSLATVGARLESPETAEPGEAPVTKAAAAAIVVAEPVKAPESVAAPVVAVPTAAAATEAPAVVEAPAAPAAAPAAPAAPEAAAAAAAPVSDKTALQEKNDARRALERGKLADAIAAGERSVALDRTDGEAWLLLGAAYQEKGHNADARRCYSSCVKEGKRGPVGECRAMIR